MLLLILQLAAAGLGREGRRRLLPDGRRGRRRDGRVQDAGAGQGARFVLLLLLLLGFLWEFVEEGLLEVGGCGGGWGRKVAGGFAGLGGSRLLVVDEPGRSSTVVEVIVVVVAAELLVQGLLGG